MWFRVAKAGGRIGYQRRVLLRYRVREGSLSGGQFTGVERGISVVEHLVGRHRLTGPEGRAAGQMLRRYRAQLELLYAKQAIRHGAFPEARRRTIQAFRYYPRLKLVGVLGALLVAPSLVRRHLPPDA